MSDVTLNSRVLELLCSRVCHDLISPVGAINNGVELVQEFGDDTMGEAMGLIADSAHKAGIHLRCFRLAYGASGAGSDVKPQDVHSLMKEWVSLTKSELEWGELPSMAAILPPRGFLKCLLNVLLLASEAQGMGGTIRVREEQGGDLTVVVEVVADRITIHEGVEEALAQTISMDDLTPRNVHGYVTKTLCDAYLVDLTYDRVAENHLIFTLKEKKQ